MSVFLTLPPTLSHEALLTLLHAVAWGMNMWVFHMAMLQHNTVHIWGNQQLEDGGKKIKLQYFSATVASTIGTIYTLCFSKTSCLHFLLCSLFLKMWNSAIKKKRSWHKIHEGVQFIIINLGLRNWDSMMFLLLGISAYKRHIPLPMSVSIPNWVSQIKTCSLVI